LTGQLFLARPSVAQMSNDEHLLGVSGAAGVLAVECPSIARNARCVRADLRIFSLFFGGNCIHIHNSHFWLFMAFCVPARPPRCATRIVCFFAKLSASTESKFTKIIDIAALPLPLRAADADAHISATVGRISPKIEPIVQQGPSLDHPHHRRRSTYTAMVVLSRHPNHRRCEGKNTPHRLVAAACHRHNHFWLSPTPSPS
jgi:hypothetical protein